MGKVIKFPGPSSLSPEIKKVLRDQVINEDGPGTILRDFQMLLEFIGQKGTKVSAKNGFLPMKALNELNTRMTRPIEIGLKRPMQKSFPHINGLYLLLRASGLASLKGSGSKRFLMPDEALCRSWAELNPTEQYFSLLEAWLIRGKSEIIGERSDFLNVPILGWFNLFKRLANQGLDCLKDKNTMDFIRYSPGTHTIGIVDLFGFITVRSGRAEPGKGWNIRKIRQTDLGVALLALLYSIAEETDQEISLDYFHTFTFGSGDTIAALQPAVQRFFPEWQHRLEIPEHEFQDGTYVFRVFLGRTWRRIAISGQHVLDDLSAAILNAYEFDFDHLYRFTWADRFGMTAEANHPYVEDEAPPADEVRIGDLPLAPGDTMSYLYDFGDNWDFEVELEKIGPPDPEMDAPVLLESRGKSPRQYYGEEDWDEDGDWEE